MVNFSSYASAMVPSDKEKFREEMKSAKFLECNKQLAKQYKQDNPDMYKKSAVISDDHLADVYDLSKLFLQYGMHLMLYSGTLLGWYRECGIIPHTTDLDTAAFISEYNETILDNLSINKQLKLDIIFGKANDSLELSVLTNRGIKIDIFFLYQSKNYTWVGGMIYAERKKLKYVYPTVSKLCRADLKGYLFHVPCNVEPLLEADYGKEWKKPFNTKDFDWKSSHKNQVSAKYYSEAEMKEVFRYNRATEKPIPSTRPTYSTTRRTSSKIYLSKTLTTNGQIKT